MQSDLFSTTMLETTDTTLDMSSAETNPCQCTSIERQLLISNKANIDAIHLLHNSDLHSDVTHQPDDIGIYSVSTPPPPPPQFHMICCYIARYYVRKWHVRLGVIKNLCSLSWGGGGGDRIDPHIVTTRSPDNTEIGRNFSVTHEYVIRPQLNVLNVTSPLPFPPII